MNDIKQRVAKAIADVIGHKQEEKCHPHAKAAIEAMKEELTLREEKLVELYCDAYIAANKLDYVKDRHIAKTRLIELMK